MELTLSPYASHKHQARNGNRGQILSHRVIFQNGPIETSQHQEVKQKGHPPLAEDVQAVPKAERENQQ